MKLDRISQKLINIFPDCVMVALQILVLTVGVRILLGEYTMRQSYNGSLSQPSKLMTRVRLPSAALQKSSLVLESFFYLCVLVFRSMKQKCKLIIIAVVLLGMSFTSCTVIVDLSGFDNAHGTTTNLTEVDCPTDIKEKVFVYANEYKNSDTEYSWGGQDPLRTIKLDCSGFVIRCYQYAVEGTDYKLLFDDTTSYNMEKYYSIKTNTPVKGDLVFMGETDSDNISHIAIFDKIENGYVYFIDCTKKDINDDGIYEINGVSERSYKVNDKRIKSFGIMKLYLKQNS